MRTQQEHLPRSRLAMERPPTVNLLSTYIFGLGIQWIKTFGNHGRWVIRRTRKSIGSAEGMAMSIMAAGTRNDARSAARLLAQSAVACFRAEPRGASKEITLNNVYRLLEAYKVDAFFGLSSSSQDFSASNEDLSYFDQSETNVADVKKAILEAQMAVYGKLDTATAVDSIISVIGSIAYPQSSKLVNQNDFEQAHGFFVDLSKRLGAQ